MLYKLTILLLISVAGQSYGGGHSWNYNLKDEMRPMHWKDYFSTCGGDMQSPIDIPRTGLPRVTDYQPLKLTYFDQAPEKMMVKNNGHTAKLSTQPFRPELTPLMSGGGLGHEYKFAQAHFHWGADESKGSEHQKSSTSFPMEMHLVHYKGTHSNIMEALVEGAHDSLAVLAVFFSVQLKSLVKMPSMELLEEALANITNSGTESEVTSFPLSDLIPRDLSEFYRYNGSLTTPSCNQIVQWTVLKKPVFISLLHLQPFRNLLTAEGDPLVDNFRPVQDIGERTILDVVTTDQTSPPLSDNKSNGVEDMEDILDVSTSKQTSILSLSDAMKKASESMAQAMKEMKNVMDIMNSSP